MKLSVDICHPGGEGLSVTGKNEAKRSKDNQRGETGGRIRGQEF